MFGYRCVFRSTVPAVVTSERDTAVPGRRGSGLIRCLPVRDSVVASGHLLAQRKNGGPQRRCHGATREALGGAALFEYATSDIAAWPDGPMNPSDTTAASAPGRRYPPDLCGPPRPSLFLCVNVFGRSSRTPVSSDPPSTETKAMPARPKSYRKRRPAPAFTRTRSTAGAHQRSAFDAHVVSIRPPPRSHAPGKTKQPQHGPYPPVDDPLAGMLSLLISISEKDR